MTPEKLSEILLLTGYAWDIEGCSFDVDEEKKTIILRPIK